MSADNGIYILVTPSGEGHEEFRVVHGFASDMEDIDILLARDFFEDAQLFDTRGDADAYAEDLSEDYSYLEYGIVVVELDEVF